MRVFLDANILFSAAQSHGVIRRLLADLRAAGHQAVVTRYVAEEARRNLLAKKPAALGEFDLLLGTLQAEAHAVAESFPNVTLALPEKDRPVLAAAIRLGCHALVTGDHAHFGPFYGQTLSGVAIHTARALAEALFGGGK